jgi:hypothetical protein
MTVLVGSVDLLMIVRALFVTLKRFITSTWINSSRINSSVLKFKIKSKAAVLSCEAGNMKFSHCGGAKLVITGRSFMSLNFSKLGIEVRKRKKLNRAGSCRWKGSFSGADIDVEEMYLAFY